MERTIKFYGNAARSRAVRKIVERSISDWVARHAGAFAGAPDGGHPRYRAFLQREGDGHLVTCQVEVFDGRRSWSGARMGQGIQQALADCLAHMSAVFA